MNIGYQLRRFFGTFVLLSMGAVPLETQARWIKKEDLNTWALQDKSAFKIFEDGSFEKTHETNYLVLKEAGKDSLISETYTYNQFTTKVSEIEGKTVSHYGEEKKVKPSNIQDKPLASSPKGFDQTRQILIAYPGLEVGSTVHFKIKQQEKPLIKKFFGHRKEFNFSEQGALQIESTLPLNVEVIDPQGYLDVKRGKKKGKFYLDAYLKRPVILGIVEENNAYYRGAEIPSIVVSNLKTWLEFAQHVTVDYEEILKQPLPSLFTTILQQVTEQFKSQSGSEVDKINAVTAALADRLTYMGDWRAVKGHFVPRDLEAIAKTRYGDCKDFAVVTVALLKALGLDAEVALVFRDLTPPTRLSALPSLGEFNHAILRVKIKEKGSERFIWVDPTNFVSFAQAPFPDIAGREALVITGKNLGLDKIPPIDSGQNVATVIDNIKILPENRLFQKGYIQLFGLANSGITGAELSTSADNIQYLILSYFVNPNQIIDKKITIPELKSRVVKETQSIDFQFTKYEPPLETSAGKALLLKSNLNDIFMDKTIAERASDLLLGTPYQFKRVYNIENIAMVGEALKSCSVNYPWFEGKLELKRDNPGRSSHSKEGKALKPSGMQLTIEKNFKTYSISNSILKSEQYKRFQDEIVSCFADFGLIYSEFK